MKFELTKLTEYSRDEIVREITRVSNELNLNPLTIKAFESISKVKIRTVHRMFGGWKEALSACGLIEFYSGAKITSKMRAQPNKYLSDDELLEELKSVSRKLNQSQISSRDFNRATESAQASVYVSRFKSWKNALKLAGLQEKKAGASVIPESVFFDNLLEVWTILGRQPKYSEMDSAASKIKGRRYHNKFGTWNKALSAFVNHINQDSSISDDNTSEKKVDKTIINVDKTKLFEAKRTRKLSLGLRFKILNRDNFKCVLCGSNPAAVPGVILHIDHILPFSKGGENSGDNLRTLCANCNVGRSNSFLN